MIVNEGWLDLDGAEERMRVFRPVVDVAYQMRFLRGNVARWNKGPFISRSADRKNGKGEGSENKKVMGM